MFESVKFIEFPGKFSPEFSTDSPAPVFKKSFRLSSEVVSAKAYLCAPSLAVVYINGKELTDNLLLSPTSDYTKTLWYTLHDASELLRMGENEIAVIIGNGFYNEALKTAWDYDVAPWRAKPKFAFSLEIATENGKELIETDGSWFASKVLSPITFNQLRCGEHYDCRKGEKWLIQGNIADFEEKAIIAEKPKGILRECKCEPIREFESYNAIKIFRNAKNNIIIDFGKNRSGYEELTLKGECGQEVIIRHSERIAPDGTLQLNDMDAKHFYANCEFETNRVILSGEVDTFKPRFAYFGFRYIEIEGADEENIIKARSIFIHQDVKKTSDFKCSNELLNSLFDLSGYSALSNMHYILTDCPTREKLGWTNDATASCEQLLTNFGTYKFFEKWLQDILDSQREDGALPGIIPSSGWGFTEYNGPICGAIILEVPLRMYQAKGDASVIKAAFPYILKYLAYLESIRDSEGFLAFWLWDWAGPFQKENLPTPLRYTDTALLLHLYDIALDFADIIGEDKIELKASRDALYSFFFNEYYDNANDRCKVSSQTALAMMIDLKEGGATEGLLEQFKETIIEKDYHHFCGMLGLQFLYKVLHKYNLDEFAYKIITAKGFPSYSTWIEDGATTLYEMWHTGCSNNHHMNSHFMMWLFSALLGLTRKPDAIGYDNIELKPFFPEDMDFARGYIETNNGKLDAEWKRENGNVTYSVSLPNSIKFELITPAGYILESEENGKFIFKKEA